MAESNLLSGSDLTELARLAGQTDEVGDAESLLDPQKISLSELPGHALRQAFHQALVRGPDLDEREREVLELFIMATSNIEELLSLYFMRYSAGKASDQKTYLYLAWMLWAFLRIRSVSRPQIEKSIYSRLPNLALDVITFNYTNFFDNVTERRVLFFHGRLDAFLRVDDRTTVTDDPNLRGATSVEGVVEFVDALRLDVQQAPAIDFPAIVPPLSFKPVMSRDQLRTWADADRVIQRANRIVVVGYSFALADEHFNDLLRQGNPRARIMVVNPDSVGPVQAACRILGVDFNSLSHSERSGFEALTSRRLTSVKGTGEERGLGLR